MKTIDSIIDHEQDWKLALGDFVFKFGEIETLIFLLCSQFLDTELINKITISNKIDKSLGYCKNQFKEDSHKIVEVLIEVRKLVEFRNSVVHGMLFGSVSIIGQHESFIMSNKFICIYLDDLKEKTIILSSLISEFKTQAINLEFQKIEMERYRVK